MKNLKEASLTLLGLALSAVLFCQGCAEITVQGHPVGPSSSQRKQIDKDGHCTKPEEGNCF
jgi:hypothetical protein